MIPKIIHYCWFGGNEKHPIIRACMDSWKKIEGYQVIEWNENNCDFDNAPAIVKKWHKEKKWAFVSDYFRLKALYDLGGVYLDTDVFFLRDFDGLLKEDLFLGYENSIYISTAVIGARQHSPIIEGLMKQYDDLNELKANNLVFNAYFKAKGMSIDGITKNEMVDGESVLILDDSYLTIGAFGRRPYTVHLAFGSWHRNSKSIINSVKLFLLKYKLVKIITIYKRLNLKIKEKANHPFFRKNSRC